MGGTTEFADAAGQSPLHSVTLWLLTSDRGLSRSESSKQREVAGSFGLPAICSSRCDDRLVDCTGRSAWELRGAQLLRLWSDWAVSRRLRT
jgi:hypothetical protein